MFSKNVNFPPNLEQMSVFVVGSGGFGGPRMSEVVVPAAGRMPDRNPDLVKEFKTSVDQVMLGFKLREIFNNYWTIFDIISLFKAYYSQCLLFCAVCKTFKTQFFVGPYLNSFRRLLFTA